MTPPDLVIFDCDGVLVDSEHITNRVLRDDLAQRGLTLSHEEVITLFVGGTMMGVRDTARDMGAEIPHDWLDQIYTAIYRALEKEVRVVPGVPEMLERLNLSGIATAVGSNGPHQKMRITLKRTGLWDRFQGRIISREDVERPKPAPDVYLAAAALDGVPPARCVVVEDSPSGARAAKAAGMTCFGYVADTNPKRLTDICDLMFDDMSKLPDLLGL